MKIGEVCSPREEIELYDGRPTVDITVANTGRHVVWVSSHFPFDQVNPRLSFDRRATVGYHLDVPAGEIVRWGPGETLSVTLVAAKEVVDGPPQPR